MRSWLKTQREIFIEGVSTHATFFTIFTASMIIVTGVGMVNGMDKWWLPAGSLAVYFLGFFLFFNARVIIKATVTIFLSSLLMGMAASYGNLFDSKVSYSMVWVMAQAFLFFLTLTVSYLLNGQRSRWTGVAFGQILGIMATATLATWVSPAVSITAGVLFGFLVFVVYYRFTLGRLGGNHKRMPHIVALKPLEEFNPPTTQGSEAQWQVRKLEKTVGFRKNKRTETAYLVWKDRAFVVLPVNLDLKLGMAGLRRPFLSYQGKSINPWLLDTVHRFTPLWRSRGAQMMPILLDVHSRNGLEPQTIGVQIPDSKRRIPVGIYPGKKFLKEGKNTEANLIKMFNDMEEFYGPYMEDGLLKPKQKKALGETGEAVGLSATQEKETGATAATDRPEKAEES